MSRHRPTDPSIASQTPPVVYSLIAQCLSDEASDGGYSRAIREIQRKGLWEYVAAESCDAGVGAVLLRRLRELNIDVPTSSVRQMAAYADHVRAANAYKVEAVSRVLARLQMVGIDYLLLKGAALNGTVYEQLERPTTDIDVLIHVADAKLADRVLGHAGCRPGADLVREDFYPRYYCEREYFTRGHPRVKIDLHCRPFHVLRYSRTVPEDAMWGDCREVRFGELTARMPGPHEMLVHLAVHAACHGNTQVRWLYDIKLWLDKNGPEIDVQTLGEKCRSWGLSLPVNRALRKVKAMFAGACKLDEAIAATSRWAGPLERLALAGAGLYDQSPALHVMCNAATAPGVRFRMGYLAATLLPDAGHLRQIYAGRHAGWQFVAHAIRAKDYVQRAFTAPV